ncbi:hypothetical protein AB1Y20_005188 [Prymnesium parvum]|uniref:RNA polymerase sigma-70 domain-containing protein n=1 Tax=Prymnesium parvum TaxID=97485 RepID=A0AB34J3J6_PRYPA
MALACLAVVYLAFAGPTTTIRRAFAPPAPAFAIEQQERAPDCVMSAVPAPASVKSSQRRNRRGGQLVSWYFNTISATRLLTAEQERTLADLIHAGDAHEAVRDELALEMGRRPTDDEWAEKLGLETKDLRRQMARAHRARDLMVAANMRLVVSIVRPYLQPNAVAGGALSMEDLVQEGSLGLLKAVNRFNPARGHRFSTYATWWIRTTVQRAVADQARTIRLPFGKSRLLSKAKRTHDELQQKYGRKPTEGELADAMQISLPQLRVLLQHWHGVGSLEAPMQVRNSASMKSTLLEAYKVRPQQQRAPQDVVEVQLVGECLRQQLQDELSPLEAQVLQLRYGLEDGDCLSWKQIAERCDQPERQLQLAQTRALRKLRKQHSLRQLHQFCDHPEWEQESMGMTSRVSKVG